MMGEGRGIKFFTYGGRKVLSGVNVWVKKG